MPGLFDVFTNQNAADAGNALRFGAGFGGGNRFSFLQNQVPPNVWQMLAPFLQFAGNQGAPGQPQQPGQMNMPGQPAAPVNAAPMAAPPAAPGGGFNNVQGASAIPAAPTTAGAVLGPKLGGGDVALPMNFMNMR